EKNHAAEALARRRRHGWAAVFLPPEYETRIPVERFDPAFDRDRALKVGQCAVFEGIRREFVSDQRELMGGLRAKADIASADVHAFRQTAELLIENRASERPSDVPRASVAYARARACSRPLKACFTSATVSLWSAVRPAIASNTANKFRVL